MNATVHEQAHALPQGPEEGICTFYPGLAVTNQTLVSLTGQVYKLRARCKICHTECRSYIVDDSVRHEVFSLHHNFGL